MEDGIFLGEKMHEIYIYRKQRFADERLEDDFFPNYYKGYFET